MKTHSLIRGLAALAFCALAPLAHADYIACPAETEWKVTTPLPDPWSSTVQVSSQYEQFTVLINAVEWLVCKYAHAQNQPSVYSYSSPNFRVRLQRPAFHGVAVNKEMCPAKTIATGVTSPVPAPWKSTKYIWNLDSVSVTSIGGQDMILCSYLAGWDSQHVGPSSLLQPLNLGDDKPLAATPKPGPRLPGNFAAEFAVMNASLATVPAPQQRACPAQVGFQGSIAVNGPGDVIYRTVDNLGNKRPQQKVHFAKAGAKPLAFQISVGTPVPPSQPGNGSLTVAPQPGGPAFASSGGGNGGPVQGGALTEAATPGKLWGFMRIEILAPSGGKTKSQDAAWSVQCVKVNQQPGAVNFQAEPKNPSATLKPSKPVAIVPPKGVIKK
jgi:hypothetical protein